MAKAPGKAADKPTKAAKKAPVKRKVNKSQAIRDYKAAHPDEGPTAIATALSKTGIKVVPAQVSNVLTNAAKKTGGGGGQGRGGKAGAKAGDKVSLSSLMDTQAFVEKVGGVDSAKQLLGAVEKLSK
ncbi:MAG: hypothetical protein AAF790_00510 [Planctomycetota bacterium]